MLVGLGWAWAVLFRAVPRPTHRVSASCPSNNVPILFGIISNWIS